MANLSCEDILLFEPRFIDPALTTGLWWCQSPEDVQAVGLNAVCMSISAHWEDVQYCSEWIKQFPYIFVASPDRDLVEKVRQHIPSMPVLYPREDAFGIYDNVKALKAACGPAAVNRLLFGAVEEPVAALLDLGEVGTVEETEIPRTLSGLPNFDRATGGFRVGELSLWTGKRGEGKSTLLGQLLLEGIDQGHHVCAYSGELPAQMFKAWTMVQAAGPKYLAQKTDKETGRVYFQATEQAARLINEWWRGKFFLCDIGAENAHDEDRILDLFEYAYRVRGCDVFLVDNVMTAELKGDRDYYRAQSRFAQRLARFAKKRNVHIHLVAHPKKTDGRAVDDSDQVSGTGDLPNSADNVFSVSRINADDPAVATADAAIFILKNRFVGRRERLGFRFHPDSRRYYPSNAKPDKAYGWEYCGEQTDLAELAGEDPEVPFEEGKK